MGKVDLCTGTTHQGAGCPGCHGRLDQVPGTEHPHHGASTRPGSLHVLGGARRCEGRAWSVKLAKGCWLGDSAGKRPAVR